MLYPRTAFYITVFSFLSLLQPILSNPVPPTLVAPDDHGTSGRTSYSGQVDESTLSPTRAARLGFEDMKKQHKYKEPWKEPSIMSSLQSAEKLFLASSVKGGFPSSLNRDPEHVHVSVQEHLNKCELVHGGKHGTGGNCGEVHAASKFFKDNPDRKHIEGGKFVAFGHAFGNKLRKGEVVPPCTGSGKHNWGCEQFVKSVTRPLDRPLTPIPSRKGVDAKAKAPAGGKPSPLRAGATQAGPPSSPGGKPSLGGGTTGRKPGKNQNAQQPPRPSSNSSPPAQAKPKQSKGQPGQPAPQGPPPGRPVAPPKQRPEPNSHPLASGSGKPSPKAPSAPRPPKDHPLPPPPPPSQRPVSALTQKQQSSGPSQKQPQQKAEAPASVPKPPSGPRPPTPPPSQRPVSALTQKQQSSGPPRPSQKQPQQKAKAPASVPKPPSGPKPPTPPPPAGRPPSPPPISGPGSPTPPPSARPASPPWQVAGKKGGQGKKGKRHVKLTRALVRQALVRRAATVGQGWEGVALS